MQKRLLLFIALLVIMLLAIGFVRRYSQSAARLQAPQQPSFRSVRSLVYVYPDSGPHAKAYRLLVENLTQRRRYLEIVAVPASRADTLPSAAGLVVIGTPECNPFLRTLLPELPVQFREDGFEFNHHRYARDTDVISFTLRHPNEPERNLTVITGNDDAEILQFLQRTRRGLFSHTGDYSIYRSNALVAYGFFGYERQGQRLRIRIRREFNFERQRKHVLRDAYWEVDYIGNAVDEQAIRDFLVEQTTLLRRQCRQLGMSEAEQRRLLPIRLVLYENAENKTLATGDVRFSSWNGQTREIHLVFSPLVRGDDYTAIARYVCSQWAGGIPNANLAEAAGVLFSNNWGGEGYPIWAGRFFFNDFFVPFPALFDQTETADISPFIRAVQLATFLQFILFHDGASSLKTLLKNTPASLGPEELERRFPARLLKLWHTWSRNMLRVTQPPDIRCDAAFRRGFCYAHEGYAVYNGYMGSTSEVALARLAEIGTNAISITPFGHPQAGLSKPGPIRRSDGPGSENDESLIVAAATARQHGMQVMLKPHLWAHGAWPGEIAMANAEDWPKFFEHYARWIIHYAILAQMYRFESLVIGLEMVQATTGQERAWRWIIERVRRLYGGEILYAANWGQEFESLTFWDALDAIGLNAYYPLARDSSATDAELLRGARRIADRIERVAQKFRKPVIITEIGFASRPVAWIEPHVDGRGQPADLQGQRRCYEAVFQALFHRPWLSGLYWWKWPTHLTDGGPEDSGFTPNGKPAEQVVARWYGQRSR